MLRALTIIGAILFGFGLGYYFGFQNAFEQAAQVPHQTNQ